MSKKRIIKREWKEKDRELRKKEEKDWYLYMTEKNRSGRLDNGLIDQLLELGLNLK
jgi:hypothetical protein